MSSEEEGAVKKRNKHSKLCMDSDDQLRAEQSEEERRKRKQEKILRKREKEIERERRHKEKEERERQREQELEREEEEQREELDYDILLLEDSNSHTSYTRVRQNIKDRYPGKKDYWEQKPLEKKPKKEAKSKKQVQESEADRQDESPVAKPKVVASRAPPQKSDPKDEVVYELAKRWWYAIPEEWPPKHFDYAGQLEKEGYRLVTYENFRKEPEVVNGLTKVHEMEGYTGVFKSTHKLIDVRPKDSCPSIENFRKRPLSQLNDLTRKAIANQIQALQKVQFKQQGQQDLLRELGDLLHKYER